LLQTLAGFYFERGDRLAQARAYLRLGDLHHDLGSVGEALGFFRRSLQLGEGDLRIEIHAHAGMSRALLRLDDFASSLNEAQTTLRLSQATGDSALEAEAYLISGIALFESREFERSLLFFRQATALANRSGLERVRAEAILHTAFAYSDMSEEWRAMPVFQEALALAREKGDRVLEALALMGMANTYSKTGEKQHALALYTQVAPSFQEIGDPYRSASLYTGMGFLYDELGDYENAKEYYGRALRLSGAVGSPVGRAGNLIHLGRIHATMRESAEALEAFHEALGLLQGLPYRGLEASLLCDIAEVLEDLGREDESIATYERALQLSRESGYARGEADILNGLGAIDRRNGRLKRARDRFLRALDLSRMTQSRYAESRALFNLGRAARDSGDWDEALKRVEDSLLIIEDLRTKISSYRLRASYLSSVREIQTYEVDLLMEAFDRSGDIAFAERAFLAAEKTKARSLLDSLVGGDARDAIVDPELLRYKVRLEERIRRQAEVWQERQELSSAGKPPPELDELLRELDRVRAILKSDGVSPPVPTAHLVGVGELRARLLSSNTALLAYFLGARASYVWVVTPSSFRSCRLPPEESIAPKARYLRVILSSRDAKPGETAKQRHERFLDSDRIYWDAAYSLSETLLGPALSEVHPDVSRLMIVGDGELQELPFSALPLPGSSSADGPLPLVARYEIIRLPSASTLGVLSRRSGSREARLKKLAVLADPVFDAHDPRIAGGRSEVREEEPGLAPAAQGAQRKRGVREKASTGETNFPRLLSTRTEAKRILRLVPPTERLEALGFDASRSLASAGGLADYEVVHFATHGILNPERPELSGIVLSLFDREGRKQDGFLRLHDISELELPVKLVVLSACSTGLGKDVRGEGPVGLVGGFLAAGAEGVIASYWNVDDEATSELMTRFYLDLFTERLPPSRALQAAQLSLWKNPRWRSPFFWAAFEFHGQQNTSSGNCGESRLQCAP
jgi:CHAT domain-containing protein/tetratricopeptide (TPR) repeat protein